jgi:cbb3-type cytochrome oxidase cytochrome c subunit
VDQEGCLACHALGEAGEHVGPRMEWIGGRRSARWIAEYLVDPQAAMPGTAMPAFAHLSPEQRGAIGAFLVSAAAEAGR